MKLQYISVAVATAALIAVGATGALAQGSKKKPAAAAAAPAASQAQAAPPLAMGPAIPGVCILSQQGIIGASAAGKGVLSRLQQLQQSVQAELGSEQQQLQTDAKALEAQKTTLPADQFASKAQAINEREAVLQRKAQVRQAELQATERKQVAVVMSAAQPLMRQAVVQHNCSIVIDGTSVMAAAQGMDITPTVVQSLDARLQPFTFERERAPEQAGAQ
jgi:outer membrane protein